MLHEKVFLTATDTAVGFVSQNALKLDAIKGRPPHKRYLRAVDSLATLKTMTRIPAAHKKRFRRQRRTTFILPNGRSFRIVRDKHHLLLLKRLKWAYSTSANKSGEAFDIDFARNAAEIVVEPIGSEGTPSQLLKLGKTGIKKVRR